MSPWGQSRRDSDPPQAKPSDGFRPTQGTQREKQNSNRNGTRLKKGPFVEQFPAREIDKMNSSTS